MENDYNKMSTASEAIKAFEAMFARLESTDGYYAWTWNEEAEEVRRALAKLEMIESTGSFG